jgi:hypothetical protein
MLNEPDRVITAGALFGGLAALALVVGLLAVYGGYVPFALMSTQTSEAPPLAEPIPTAPSTN